MCNDSEAEHIALLAVSLAENFRSHVSHSAAFGPSRLLPQGWHLERKPKINYFHLVSVDVDNDVLGFEVAMDDAAFMALPHAHQNISEKVLPIGRREVELHANETHKVHSWQILHQQHVLIVSLMKLPQLVDVTAFPKSRENATFLSQHRNRGCSGRFLTDHLRSKLKTASNLSHPMHSGKTPLAELLQHLELLMEI